VIDLAVIAEGPTEQAFVRNCLVAHLGAMGVSIWARLPGRAVRRGGVRPWDSVCEDILGLLKERPGRVCTTMFDFYAMPGNWPGRTDAGGMPLARKGPHVEDALLEDMAAHAGGDFRRELFVPYVQVHEFEALLFAGVAEMAEALAPISQMKQADLNAHFRAVVDQAGQPEAINDNYDTCPSRRITGVVRGYRKPVFGPIIAGRIGLDVLRTACPHFGQWLGRLESLSAK